MRKETIDDQINFEIYEFYKKIQLLESTFNRKKKLYEGKERMEIINEYHDGIHDKIRDTKDIIKRINEQN